MMLDDDFARKRILQHWLETDFRAALDDNERLLQAAATMRVAMQNGDPAIHAVRVLIGDFVVSLIDPGALGEGSKSHG